MQEVNYKNEKSAFSPHRKTDQAGHPHKERFMRLQKDQRKHNANQRTCHHI